MMGEDAHMVMGERLLKGTCLFSLFPGLADSSEGTDLEFRIGKQSSLKLGHVGRGSWRRKWVFLKQLWCESYFLPLPPHTPPPHTQAFEAMPTLHPSVVGPGLQVLLTQLSCCWDSGRRPEPVCLQCPEDMRGWQLYPCFPGQAMRELLGWPV